MNIIHQLGLFEVLWRVVPPRMSCPLYPHLRPSCQRCCGSCFKSLNFDQKLITAVGQWDPKFAMIFVEQSSVCHPLFLISRRPTLISFSIPLSVMVYHQPKNTRKSPFQGHTPDVSHDRSSNSSLSFMTCHVPSHDVHVSEDGKRNGC